MENPQLNWMSYVISSPEIKVEPEPNPILISPPSSPHLSSSLSVTSSSSRRRDSTSSLAGPKRTRPYPPVAPNQVNSPRRTKSDIGMSTNDSFGTWSTMRSASGRGRRSSDEGEQAPYNMPPYMNDYLTMADSSAPTSELTPPSSSSSLSGAMGGDGSRSSRSPPSTSVYGGHGSMPQDLAWNNQQMSSGVGMVPMNGTTYPGVTGGFSPSVSNLYDYHTTRNGSPTESISSQNPQAYPGAYDQYGLSRNSHMGMSSHRSNGYTSNPLAPFPQPAELSMPVDSSSAESEIRRLRRRVRELEMENSRARNALESLRSNAPNPAGLPTPPHSSSFQAGWKARTEARKKLFCSLNRAGNALCAWHDSRRERRAYPPRNAPPGYLNCGCTYEQALFEESLARHGVGSYHPGETVRMDPALRNPLLKLLEQRYGYKDGDFEHDPLTEEWHEGESPAVWEQKVLSGQAVRRRPDNHSHDRR